MPRVWYDKHRACQDGSKHFGNLELITWSGRAERNGPVLGWGACFKNECDELKRVFEEDLRGDESKFYSYRPQAFRWTCCGLPGDMDYGCADHGTVSDRICKENEQATRGLTLSQGPDPRSYNPMKAQINTMMRGLYGMDDEDGSGDAPTARFGKPTNLMQMISQDGRYSPSRSEDMARALAADHSSSGSESRSATSRGCSSNDDCPTATRNSSSKSKMRTCGHCGTQKPCGSIQRCSRCKHTFYCTAECQKAAWPDHKKECKQMAAA